MQPQPPTFSHFTFCVGHFARAPFAPNVCTRTCQRCKTNPCSQDSGHPGPCVCDEC